MDRNERAEWEALAEGSTLHMLPTEALVASIKHLATRLLALDLGRDEMIEVATQALKGVMEYEDDEDPECLATVVVDALRATTLNNEGAYSRLAGAMDLEEGDSGE